MTNPKPNKPGPLFRALAVLGGGLVFVLIASVIHPGASTANQPIRPVPSSITSLGSIESDKYIIQIISATPNALYTVRYPDGAVVKNAHGLPLENATADELYRFDPEHLDVSRLVANQMSDVDSREF